MMPRKSVKVLVVGQTPPPFHGQAIMIDMLVKGPLADVSLHHVRMAFSDKIDLVGKLQVSKIPHVFSLILQIVWMKVRFNPTVLYYPPAGLIKSL